MVDIYDDFLELGVELFEVFAPNGPNAKFKARSDNQTANATPWIALAETEKTFDVAVIFTLDKLEDRQRIRIMKDSEVVDGMVNALMLPSPDFVPKAKDFIIRNGVVLKIVAIDVYDPYNKPVLYEMELGT